MVALPQDQLKTVTNSDKLDSLFDKINAEFDTLDSFLKKDEEKSDRFRLYIKSLYDFIKIQDDNDYISTLNNSKKSQSSNQSSALPELIVDKNLVDLEQIYQQLQLYNQNSDLTSSASINSLTKFFSKCLVQPDLISFNIETDQNGARKNNSASSLSNEDSAEIDADEEDEDEDEYDDEEDEDKDSIDDLIKYTKSQLDEDNQQIGIPDGDDSEIEDFEVEQKEESDENDDQDEDETNEENNQEIDSDEVDEDLVDIYDDIDAEKEKEILGIGKPQKAFDEIDFDREDFGLDDNKLLKSKDLFAVEDEHVPDEKKSSFERRSEKLKEQIEEIHETMLNNLTDKPWPLKGEVTAKNRPQDSLLEEYVEFDHTTRQAPVMDASTSEQIEKIIKQRIKDKAFDDVERKVKPVDMQYEYKKQVVLDSEKSKVGLGDVYEQEYMKQQQKELGDQPERPREEAADPRHEEIRKKMQQLFIKLDALSNFHFTPKAPVPELKVVSNMPSIAMEEVAPVNVADANVLAPEEVKSNIKSLPKSKSEESKADKNRNLRAKKLISRKRKNEKEKRLQLAQALDPNNERINKEIAMNNLKKQAKNLSKNIKILKQDKNAKTDKAYKSSTAFFKQMQENQELGKSKILKKKLDKSDETKNSKKFKL